MKTLLTKEQTCKLFGCTLEQLNAQYAANAEQLKWLHSKAVTTNKKVNGFTAGQLNDLAVNFNTLAQ